jgi:hypothetical protein
MPAQSTQPAQPAGGPVASEPLTPAANHTVIGTVVQAAAELAEIGLRAGARAISETVARLPRP